MERKFDREQLRAWVYETLCEREQLEAGQFSMIEQELEQQGRSCGVLFRLIGPRQVRASAIWTREEQAVVFYGSAGHRFQRTQVSVTEIQETHGERDRIES